MEKNPAPSCRPRHGMRTTCRHRRPQSWNVWTLLLKCCSMGNGLIVEGLEGPVRGDGLVLCGDGRVMKVDSVLEK